MDTQLALTAIGLAAVATAGYALSCWWWPYGACRRCNGTGKRHSPTFKHFRLCPRCKGNGRRLRLGRHLHNYFTRNKPDAS